MFLNLYKQNKSDNNNNNNNNNNGDNNKNKNDGVNDYENNSNNSSNNNNNIIIIVTIIIMIIIIIVVVIIINSLFRPDDFFTGSPLLLLFRSRNRNFVSMRIHKLDMLTWLAYLCVHGLSVLECSSAEFFQHASKPFLKVQVTIFNYIIIILNNFKLTCQLV